MYLMRSVASIALVFEVASETKRLGAGRVRAVLLPIVARVRHGYLMAIPAEPGFMTLIAWFGVGHGC